MILLLLFLVAGGAGNVILVVTHHFRVVFAQKLIGNEKELLDSTKEIERSKE